MNEQSLKRLKIARTSLVLAVFRLSIFLASSIQTTSLAAQNDHDALQQEHRHDSLLSIAETRALLKRGQELTSKPFTFEAALIFVTEHRGSAMFQQAQHSINVALSHELRLKLQDEPAGCLVRVSGVTSPHAINTPNFIAQEVRIVDRNHRVKPMAANIELGHNKVPLNKLAREQGRVKEVLWTKGRMRLFLSIGNHSKLKASLFEETDLETARQLVGARISVEGCLTLATDAYPVDTVHEILMIDASQLKVLEPPSRSFETSYRHSEESEEVESDENEVQKRHFAKISGLVAYTDGVSEFAVVGDQHRYLVRSNFASKAEVGSSVKVEGWQSWNSKKDVAVIQGRLIYGLGKGALLVPQVTTPTKLLTLRKFPSLVTLRGHVINSLYREHVCIVKLEHDGVLFNASIGFDDSQFEHPSFPLIPGTLIDVTGVPIRYPMGSAITSSSPRGMEVLAVLVGSPDNVKTIERTMSLSRLRVAIALGVIALAFGLTLTWTYALKRRVESRTRSLVQITSQMQTSFDAMREAVLVIDSDGCIVQANRRFRELFGVEAKPSDNFDGFMTEIAVRLKPADAVDLLRNCRNHSGTVTFPIEMLVRNTTVYLHVYSGPICTLHSNDRGRLFVFDDVTEQRKIQAKLTHAQKMEAVGQLSGGIAHDFNRVKSRQGAV